MTTKSAKVYTIGLRAKGPADSHEEKILKLAEAIGINDFDWRNKLVAVKTHFGEDGNSAFPRPHYLRPIVELIKDGGGKPFLAETTTLYTGSRSNAPDHIMTAVRHGFGTEVTGAPVIICDGLTGRYHEMVKIDGKHFKEVSIAGGIYEADALVAFSHFKGHEVTSFGGAIKNMGMGCCSRAAKLAMHTAIRPDISPDVCVRCKRCISWCPAEAISQPTPGGPVVIDHQKCRGCGECLMACLVGAININWSSDAADVTEKMVEHALGVFQNKRGSAFFINVLMNISPLCDCCGFADSPIVPDIGFAASTDPVALDACSLDMVNEQIGLQNTALKHGHAAGEAKFQHIHDKIDNEAQLRHAVDIGMGSRVYERISLD